MTFEQFRLISLRDESAKYRKYRLFISVLNVNLCMQSMVRYLFSG